MHEAYARTTMLAEAGGAHTEMLAEAGDAAPGASREGPASDIPTTPMACRDDGRAHTPPPRAKGPPPLLSPSSSGPAWSPPGGGDQDHLLFVRVTSGQPIRDLRVINSILFPMAYQEKYYREVLSESSFAKLVYWRGSLVGTFSCRMQDSCGLLPAGAVTGLVARECYIMTIGVLAPFRKRGFGSRLLDDIVASAREHHEAACSHAAVPLRIILHVHLANEMAIQFYLKKNFSVIATIPEYYKRLQPSSALLLVKDTPTLPAVGDAV